MIPLRTLCMAHNVRLKNILILPTALYPFVDTLRVWGTPASCKQAVAVKRYKP